LVDLRAFFGFSTTAVFISGGADLARSNLLEVDATGGGLFDGVIVTFLAAGALPLEAAFGVAFGVEVGLLFFLPAADLRETSTAAWTICSI
jgi:hypothetical protein